MNQGNWISLVDYSMKYSISVSTLRRRIRDQGIHFRLEQGRYLLLDEPSIKANTVLNVPKISDAFVESYKEEKSREEKLDREENEEPRSSELVKTVNQLLEEIKKAYTLVLQEKEEQILQLKKELTDLKTLVQVMESVPRKK